MGQMRSGYLPLLRTTAASIDARDAVISFKKTPNGGSPLLILLRTLLSGAIHAYS